MLVKYLVRDGDEWEVTPNLQAMCSFQYANPVRSAAQAARLRPGDAAQCAAVLSQQDRSCVFSDVYRQMAPGGYLMLGAAEQAERTRPNLFQAEFCPGLLLLSPHARFVGPFFCGLLRYSLNGARDSVL